MWKILGVWMVVGCAAAPAFAETVELVTYYPAPSAQDLHVKSLTVGTGYAGETPGDGVALIQDKMGIGTASPQGSLHIVGPDNDNDSMLFVPGEGGSVKVGIGTATPSASAALQVDSTSGGFLPPRMTTEKRQAIASPAAGLMVFDTTLGTLMFYNGTGWMEMWSGAAQGPPVGTILAWHKSLTGTPALPAGWVECNGQTLSDPGSPYHGQVIPNLNQVILISPAWPPPLKYTGRFLRGGTDSGLMQEATEHSFSRYVTQWNTGFPSVYNAYPPNADTTLRSGSSMGGSIGSGGGPELWAPNCYTSRPVSMTVVYIIRVK